MGKIMVVDDESLIREWLVMCLVESGIAEKAIDQAKNGEEALKLLENNIYDCIFTDITMPQLDGIELIRRIRENDEEVQIIILSCHDDFDLARKAVKYNVSEYLLKSELSKEDIAHIVNKVKKSMNRGSNDEAEKTEFFCKVLHREYSVQKEDLTTHHIELANKFFALAIQNRKLDVNSVKALYSKYSDIAEYFYDGVSKLLFLLNFNGADYYYGETLQSLKKKIKDILGNQTVVGVSGIYRNQEAIGVCLNEALIDWEKQFFGVEDGKEDGFTDEDETNVSAIKLQIKGMGESIIYQYSLSGKDCVADNIDQLYLFAKDNKIWDSEFLKRMVIDILEGIEIKIDMKDAGRKTYLPQILGASDWKEITEYITQFLSGIKESNTQSDSIKNAKKYINLHYDQSITLSELANQIGLSEEYFSRLFKKEVGKNFTEYMTELRMEKARTLLKQGIFNINEVAEMVGITNHSYFSSQFKKYFGVNPSSVRGSDLP